MPDDAKMAQPAATAEPAAQEAEPLFDFTLDDAAPQGDLSGTLARLLIDIARRRAAVRDSTENGRAAS